MSADNHKKRIRLEDIPNESPFRAPEGYFEDFTERLNRRIEEEAGERQETVRPWIRIRAQLALAASIIVFAVFSTFAVRFLIHGREAAKPINFAGVVEANIEGYDIDQISGLYTESMAGDTTTERSAYTDAAINYLLDEDVDLSLLTENL